MKLKSALIGITALCLCWMTAAFIRTVPVESYQQYSASEPETVEEIPTEAVKLEVEAAEASASIN